MVESASDLENNLKYGEREDEKSLNTKLLTLSEKFCLIDQDNVSLNKSITLDDFDE